MPRPSLYGLAISLLFWLAAGFWVAQTQAQVKHTRMLSYQSSMSNEDEHAGEPLVSRYSVVINGTPISGVVLDKDGKHFVAIEDIAQSLGGKIGYDQEHIALMLQQLSSVSTESLNERPKTGRVKGVLTYYFNENYGSKPDTGSKVWLVEGHKVVISEGASFFALGDSFKSGVWPPYKAVKHSVADGNGIFELPDVPAGSYTLVMESNHTKGSTTGSVTPRDVLGRVISKELEVKAGETTDASFDFGVSAF